MEAVQRTESEAADYVMRVKATFPEAQHRSVEKFEVAEKVEEVEIAEKKLDFQSPQGEQGLRRQRSGSVSSSGSLTDQPELATPQEPKPTSNNPGTTKPGRGLVARPLGYVLERLPSAVSGRVLPVYQSYAKPAVEKVDDVLFAVGDRGSEILSGARAKVSMLKPWRLMAAAERTVDRLLPPTHSRVDGEEEALLAKAVYEDAELSTYRRGLALLDTLRTRAYVHSEVKIIMMKVKTRVWFDMTVTRRYKALVAGTKSLQCRTRARALASKKSCLAHEKRAEAYVVRKCAPVKSKVVKHTTAASAKASALKKKALESITQAKESGADRARPYTDALKERVKPLRTRLSAWFQKLREAKRKCIAYAVQKRNMITNRAKAVITTVQENLAEKCGTTWAITTKYGSRSANYARATLEKVLGPGRSAKFGGLLNRYAPATIAHAVRAHAA